MDETNEWEKEYGSAGRSHKNRYPYNEIVSFIIREVRSEDNSKIKVLDIGCGWGNNLSFLDQEGFDAYGIDISETAIKNCKKLVKNPEKIKIADAEKLEYPENFFDCVIDRCSIQHNSFEKIEIIIKEVKRVLKKNGKFYSILISKTNIPFSFQTSYLTKEQVIELFKEFSKAEIDYTIQTLENGKIKKEWWNIKAIK